MASPTEPMPEAKRLHHLGIMWAGLAALQTEATPTTDHWRVVSDAVNLMETLVRQGKLADESGLLDDAVAALANAGKRHLKTGAAIRLDGPGIAATRAVLHDYEAALHGLSHRAMLQCHLATERRIRAIHSGKAQPHDVEVVDL